MADGKGMLEILLNRRFEDYRSLKQHFQRAQVKEILFNGNILSTATLQEVEDNGGATISRLGAKAAAYIRTEADAAGVRDKTLTIEFLDDAGIIYEVEVNTDDTNSTTETIIEADLDYFYRLRSFKSAVEAPAGNFIMITDDDYDVGNEVYGIINDGRKHSAFSRYFVPAATICASYLGKVKAVAQVENEGDQVEQGHQLAITFTPAGESVDVTITIDFLNEITWEPCIELEPATDVIFKVKKIADNDHHEIFLETAILEALV